MENSDLLARVIRGDARGMIELADDSIDLVVTSPPYWQIKDYGSANQIGFGQSLYEYLSDLGRVWAECARVLRPGRRLCINIGDQFARASVFGRYKIIPLHAEIIAQCELLGLDYLGAIIWQKKTTLKPSGGATIMGSYPFPPNGIVELDYEYILLFRKQESGKKSARPAPEDKAASALSKKEWKEFFSGHWQFAGARQNFGHEAVFPEELPHRLIRMFSFAGETVLDPFLGSGTTAKVALSLGRCAVGYEINPDYLPLIQQRLCDTASMDPALFPLQIIGQAHDARLAAPPAFYAPMIQDARPIRDEMPAAPPKTDTAVKVVAITEENTLEIEGGRTVAFCGLQIPDVRKRRVREYLDTYLLGKRVLVEYPRTPVETTDATLPAYVRLRNRLFVNRKMIEMGLAQADREASHPLQARFIQAEAAETIGD